MASHERRPTRRVEQDLQAIGALTQAILDGIDVEELLGRIAGEARAMADAAVGVVITVAGSPGVMQVRAVDGLSAEDVRVGFEMPVANSLTELVLKRGVTFVARSASEMPMPDRGLAASIKIGPLVAAPLAEVGTARGVLVVARPDGSAPFPQADVEMISIFASQAASAIELFGLRSAETSLAKRIERDRIARDLNAEVVEALTDVELSVRALGTGATDSRLIAGIDGAAAQLRTRSRPSEPTSMSSTRRPPPNQRIPIAGGQRVPISRGQSDPIASNPCAALAHRPSRPSAAWPLHRPRRPRTTSSGPWPQSWSAHSTGARS